MGYNILLKIVALAVVFVIVTSCVTSTVAVADDSSNTAVSIRSEEFNGALAIIPSPFPSPMLPPFYEGRLFTTTAATPEHPPPPLPKPFENEIDMPVSEEDFSNPLFVDEDPFNYTDDPFRYPPDETAYPPSPPVSKENISRRTLEKLDQKVSHSNTSHSSNTIYVPDDYAKIQWAVDNASAGDTIIVDASGGPYYENVVVNKQLYLLGNGMPIVDAGGSSSAITISADGITLEGFSAKNSGSSVFDAGIEVTADNNIIAGNNLSGNNEGIYLQSSCNNIIKNNSADHNRRGIYLGFSSNDNTVMYNSAKNSEYGILIEGSSRNTIQDNFVNNNGPLETDEKFGGIRLYNARDNIILNNTAVNNTHGILLMRSGSNDNHIVGNYVQDNRLGIYLWDKCSGNIIRDNNLSNNIYGIRLYHSDSNTITDNLATNTNVGFGISGSNCTNINNNLANNNNIGFSFSSSNNNTVNNNTANSNSRGIMLSFVSNHIFRNNLMSSNEYNFYADGYAPNDIDISNLVDGKPIYYLVGASDMVIDLSSNACTVYCIDCNNISVMNLNLSYKNYHGVYFYNTSNSKILNNHIRENGKGIYFDSSSNNMIFNNSFNDNEGGIYIWDSTKNVIKGNKGSNNGGGIYLGYSSNNSLKDNDLRYNNYGTCLAYSSGNDLKNNTAISNNLYGIRLFSSSKNNVANNNASNNDDYGIYLRSSNNNSLLNNTATSNNNKSGIFVSWYSNNNTITNNTANSNFYSGIEVSQSNNNTISNNSLNSNDNYGISLESANNNILINNNASDNSIGITLYGYSCYNTLTNNTANSNFLGIELGGNGNNTVINNAADMNRYGGFIYSDNNILINNTASNNNDSGIEMEYSSGNTLTNNRMSGNNYNFGVSGDCLSHFIHDIDTSNSGDGKPVYYWIDQKDQQIPADAGFVGIVNSTNIMVRDLILTNNSAGVLLAYSSNSTIENVKASNNIGGIWLIGSDSNRLTNSTFSKNYYGVYLDYSSNNSIFRNNFINNSGQPFDDAGTNSWDNGYPSGGNYWSDYNGSDIFSGPYQNITGSDGIGDTPYTNISGDAGAEDKYPLMEPWGLIQRPDLTLQPQDIVILNGTEEKIIDATIHNIGNADANNVVVQIFDGHPNVEGTQQLGANQTINSITAGGTGTAQVSLSTAVKINDIWVVIDPDDAIRESNEWNNMAYAHIIALDVSSLYSTFYRYADEHIESDDPIIITTLAYSKLNGVIIPCGDVTIHAEIKDEFDNIIGIIEGKTDGIGLARLGLDYLDEGIYDISVKAYDNQNNYISPLGAKRISIVESDLDLHLDMKPLGSYKEEFDLGNDGYTDYYIDKWAVTGSVLGELDISTDINLIDARVMIDPMSYHSGLHSGSWINPAYPFKRNLGNILAGSERTVTFDLGEAANGERYALVEAQGGDKLFLCEYATKVTPVIYLLFKDEDGKIHRIVYQNIDKGRSFVFPYDRPGVSADVVTYTHGHVDEILALGIDGTKELAVSTGYLREVGAAIKVINTGQGLINFVSFASELQETNDWWQEPPSEAKNIRGIARSVGVCSKATKFIGSVAVVLVSWSPPAWFVAGTAACNIVSLGYDLLADHVEKEHMNFEQMVTYDMKTLPYNAIDERIDADVVMHFMKWETWIGWYFLIQFMNIQIEDKKVEGMLEVLKVGKYSLTHHYESEDFRFDLPAGDYEQYSIGNKISDSCILRYYIENPDGSREINTYIDNAMGLQDLNLLDSEGRRRFKFHPGDDFQVEFTTVNLLDFDVRFDWKIEILDPGGKVVDYFLYENYFLPTKGDIVTAVPFQLPENAITGKYTVSYSMYDQNGLYDVCNYYQFYVEESTEVSYQICQHESISIDLNLTDNVGNPITDANITARIENPIGILETLTVIGDANGKYFVVYNNDTVFGPYRISLLIEWAGYIKYVQEIFNKQNTSSVTLSNITLPSKMRVNQTYPIEGHIKNNGTNFTDLRIIFDSSQLVEFNGQNVSSSYTMPLDNISVGEERLFTVNLTPSTAEKLYLRFKVMNGSDTLNEYFQIADVEQEIHKILLSSSSVTYMVWEGENATYTLFVSNRGNVKENVTLNVTVPIGWNYLLNENNIQVNPNAINSSRLIVTPPCLSPSSGVINVTANSGSGINSTILLQCYVIPLIPVIEISPDLTEVTTYPNQTIIINCTLTEIANKSSATGLCVNVSELKSETDIIGHECFEYSIEPFNLTKGESKNISLTVHIPKVIPPGVYKGILDVYGNNTEGDCAGLQITIQAPIAGFDTNSAVNPYPSIPGTHNGTIIPFYDLTVSKLYTYPCPETGGHAEYVELWNSTGWNVTATWNGYVGDWHNLTFNESFTLYKDETYNFTIKTGSYPQIIHESPFNATGGTIRCTSFEDANGEVHADWIPAIRLE